jgi:hypothetical protein
MFLFLLVNFVNAYTWSSYGGDTSYMSHTATGGFVGRMDLGATKYTTGVGYTTGSIPSLKFPTYFRTYPIYEPMIHEFGSGSNYLVFPERTKLQVYNDNMFLIEEVSVGEVTGQIDLTQFDDPIVTGIAGLYEFNDTLLEFQFHEFNASIPLLTLTYDHNFSVNADYYSPGVRCSGAGIGVVGECYFTITEPSGTTFYYVNTTDITSVSLSIGNELVVEPVSWLDIDNDGDTEFLIYTNKTYVTIEKDGVIEVQRNATSYPVWEYEQVMMFQNDLTNDWRFAVIEMKPNFATSKPEMIIYVFKDDNTIMWSDTLIDQTKPHDVSPSSYWVWSKMAIVSDWEGDGDGLNDIYVTAHKELHATIINNSWTNFSVYRGYDGDVFMSYLHTENQSSGTAYRSNISLSLADMNNDDYEDFIYKWGVSPDGLGNRLLIASGIDGSMIFSDDTTAGVYSCVPADLDFDGFLDVICSGDDTDFFASSGINNNSQIDSVAYSPGLSVGVNQTLSAIVTASDDESDTILYREKCSNAESWSVVSTNPTRTCVYASVGTYNMSVGVRDTFHSDYDIFSQSILVTETGTICDNDGICEAGQGETYLNCADCSAPNVTTSSVNGSLPIPTQLVDPVNTNQGLLPEIYYGTLGFMSSVLSPLIVLVFLILFAMIIITIGVIIRKIAVKVSNVRR